MNGPYSLSKPVRRSIYARFKHRLRVVAVVLAVVIIGIVVIMHNINAPSKNPLPVSSPQTVIIGDGEISYTSPYFTFKDTGGKWVLEKDRSTSSTFIYDKYEGEAILGQIIFYINSNPDMSNGVTRVLPVRIVNDNSFQVTGVSGPCVTQYGPNEPHIIKQIEDQNVLMYCDAGDDQYTVVVGQVGGDYHLNLKRSNGSPLQVEIVYKDNSQDPGQSSLINVIDSFQAN